MQRAVLTVCMVARVIIYGARRRSVKVSLILCNSLTPAGHMPVAIPAVQRKRILSGSVLVGWGQLLMPNNNKVLILVAFIFMQQYPAKLPLLLVRHHPRTAGNFSRLPCRCLDLEACFASLPPGRTLGYFYIPVYCLFSTLSQSPQTPPIEDVAA